MTKITQLNIDLEGKLYLRVNNKEVRAIPIGEPYILSNIFNFESTFDKKLLTIIPKNANAFTVNYNAGYECISELKNYAPMLSNAFLYPIQFYKIEEEEK